MRERDDKAGEIIAQIHGGKLSVRETASDLIKFLDTIGVKERELAELVAFSAKNDESWLSVDLGTRDLSVRVPHSALIAYKKDEIAKIVSTMEQFFPDFAEAVRRLAAYELPAPNADAPIPE